MKYAHLLLGCIIVITAAALPAMPQSRTSEPIKVTTPTINARATRTRSWMNQPLVQVENISNKTIEYLTIEVMLPGVTEPFMLAYGRQPGKPADKNVQVLQPGAKVDLSVDQNACELIRKSLFKMDARSMSGNKATTNINGVMFNDQTGWFGGLPHVMEPNNPLRWKVVRNTSRASTLNESPMFSFLKVGLRETSNAESSQTICSDIIGSYYVDCCGIQQISLLMIKGSGEWIPRDVVTSCCEYRDADPCF